MAKELSIFRGKKQIQKLREGPLEATRNVLSDTFGVPDGQGRKRLQSLEMHWPSTQTHGCWALSIMGQVTAWTEAGTTAFVTKLFINDAHGIFRNGNSNFTEAAWNTLLTSLEARIADNSLLPCEVNKATLTAAAIVQGRGLGKGGGKGAR